MNLTPDPSFDDVYQLEEVDFVLGGPGGTANVQPQQLANRTEWLRLRALASLRMEAVTPITGVYNITTDDIGNILTVNDPSVGVLKLPALRFFNPNNPFTIIVNDDGSANTIPLEANGSEIIEDYLDSGEGVSTYNLIPGTRVVLIATATSWLIILKTTPQAPVAGFLPGDIVSSAAPALRRTGFLLCDGSIVPRADYPELFAAITVTYGAGDGETTFQLPDHRDIFFRAYNGGGIHDPGRVFGTYQADTFLDHTHNTDVQETELAVDFGDGSTRSSWTGEATSTKTSTGASTGAGMETKPKNISVNTFIKF